MSKDSEAYTQQALYAHPAGRAVMTGAGAADEACRSVSQLECSKDPMLTQNALKIRRTEQTVFTGLRAPIL